MTKLKRKAAPKGGTKISRRIMSKIIKEILTVASIWYSIDFAWQILELLMYGEIQPREVDTIVKAVLTASLYINFRRNEK